MTSPPFLQVGLLEHDGQAIYLLGTPLAMRLDGSSGLVPRVTWAVSRRKG